MRSLYEMPRNLVLAASAGTGKTHALVGVVLHLLLGGRAGGAVDPARIVATTFSRKAAAEIRARVASEVEKLVLTPASSFYATGLKDAIGGRGGDAELSKRARKALARLPHARFGTLHSFATGIVQRYAVEIGLGPGFELAPEADTRARADDAIARALERRLDRDADALRVLAEAAGGIDRLVFGLRRVLAQLEEDGRSARELVLDPTDAATVEREMDLLIHHARAVAGHPKTAEPASALLHAFGKNDETAIEAAASALTGLAARGAKTPELESFFVFRDELPGVNHADRGRRLARAWRSRHAFASHAALVRDVLAEAEADIERAGRTRAVLGFGEVLRAARSLLTSRPDVAEEVAAGIDALLVDEFQDTSRVQRDLLQLLWARSEARPPAGEVPPLSALRPGGLLVVGDRKQSIYGFRGADVGVFAELAVGLAGTAAREALGIPPGVTWEPKEPIADFHALRHNRRSVPAILAFANAFSARRFVPGDPPPELFEIAYVPETEDLLVPPERANAPAAAVPAAPPVTWLRVQPKGATSTRLEEALVIAAEVPRLRDAGRALRDIAVLATTNGMLDAVSFALAQADIPYVVAGKGFFRAREVADLAAMLAFVLDPRDRIAMLEVLRGPWTGVHDETLLALVEPGKGLVHPSRWSAPPTPALVRAEDRAALDRTARLVASLERAAGRLGPGTILREAIAATDLESLLASLPRGEQRVANVRKLLALADKHADPRAFRAWLDDAKEQDVAESEAATFSEDDDAVRLLTVHASKGLDFPVVFIPEIGAGLPRADKNVARIALGAGDAPNVLSVRVADESGMVLEPPSYARAHALARRRERAERQRLAYVAVTRAAEEMFFVGGRSTTKDLDMGSVTLGVLEDLSADLLAVRDVEVPAPAIRDAAAAPADFTSDSVAAGPAPSREPRWQVLPIAPTALADFEHCGRRFELVHLLGLPEHARGARGESAEGALDARAQGTIAHEVLERLPREAFGAAAADEAVTRVLASIGVPPEHPQHDAIAARVLRFTGTRYARAVAENDALVEREVAFVLPVLDAEGRAVTLRGSMDLVVLWPDGAVDVVDYKSARSGRTESYAFQLDVYALAARARYPEATRLRAGLAFLGGGDGEPAWRELPPEADVRARIARLGSTLVRARWRDAFPRVEIEKCESIHCGFIGRCHPR
ncbi:MAG: UvrD-helicase domain-containing protein [Labilithrix sp.]|nr:UvrD-helicase domain-containing protein [Labilithrix sp.]MCW5815058.1 UvrD-helicase domain-containing protein [Labilithrix sp.]